MKVGKEEETGRRGKRKKSVIGTGSFRFLFVIFIVFLISLPGF